MIQCVSPHLAIDQNAYKLYLDQYQRWLFRIRYACTYHHPKIQDTVTNNIPSFTKMPNIPSSTPAAPTPTRRNATLLTNTPNMTSVGAPVRSRIP
jgi:hypothetical protein